MKPDFGWTGWEPLPLEFCNDALPKLKTLNVSIPREIQNDCDAGDRSYITNATAFQSTYCYIIAAVTELTSCLEATAAFAGQVLLKKNAHAIVRHLFYPKSLFFSYLFSLLLADDGSRSLLGTTSTTVGWPWTRMASSGSRKPGRTCTAKESSRT
jgi:hypothetical protein